MASCKTCEISQRGLRPLKAAPQLRTAAEIWDSNILTMHKLSLKNNSAIFFCARLFTNRQENFRQAIYRVPYYALSQDTHYNKPSLRLCIRLVFPDTCSL